MKLLKKLFIPLCLTVMTMAGVTACSALEPIESTQESISISVPEPISYTLNLTADKVTAKRGDVVTFTAYRHSDEAEDELISADKVELMVEGVNDTAVDDTKLTITIPQDTVANTIIKVKAKVGKTVSNSIEIKVEVPLEKLNISTTSEANILKGTSTTLTKTITPIGADTTGFAWVITEGDKYASMNGDVLVVSNDAPTGTSIKVKAVCGEIESKEELSFIVGYPLTGLTLADPEATNILSGGKIDLSVTKTPENATEDYTWEFVEGNDFASFVGDTLIVNQNVATGSVIRVKAVCGEFETKIVKFIVGYPMTDLTIEEPTATNLLCGESITLNVTKEPANTTENYTWEFVEGGDFASFAGDTLTVKQGVATGSVIKVKAVCGEFATKEATFVVGYPLTDLILKADVSTNVRAGSSLNFSVTKVPENTTNGDFEWKITSENENCYTFDEATGKLTVSFDTPDNTEITVQAIGAVESNIVTVIVGEPLTSLQISSTAPAVLTHGESYALTLVGSPENANTKGVEWVFSNRNWATVTTEIVGSELVRTLTVSKNMPHGATLTVQAVSGNIESNVLSFTVGTGLSSLSVTVLGKQNVDPGASTQLAVSALPNEATDKSFDLIVEGKGSIVQSGSNYYLKVNDDAKIGETITVKAVSTNSATVVESKPVTITVGVPVENVSISLAGSANIERGQSRTINVDIHPNNASIQKVEWEFELGEKYCTIVNNTITINEDAPIGNKITFKAVVDGHTSNPITVTIGIPVENVTISLAGSANIDPNQSRSINVDIDPDNASIQKVEWEFVEGASYCSIANNIITINENAPIGAKIVFKAIVGGKTSNSLEVTVGTPITGVSISLVGSANIDPNQSRPINVDIDPDNATAQKITWVFEAGEGYCTIVNNTITINKDVTIGTQISFKAVVGGHTSNTIHVTVGTPITNISITSNKTEIKQGEEAKLSVKVTPDDASAAYSWAFIEGGNYASIEDNILSVSKNAPVGTIIKVKAVSGSTESNILTFKVLEATYYLSFNQDTLTVDSKGTMSSILTVTLLDAEFTPVTDKRIIFTVIEGSQYLTLKPDGYSCTLVPTGHGTAYVEVSIEGLNISKQAIATVIVPPTSIMLPEVFAERTGYNYNFSMYDHNDSTGAKAGYDALPFVATASGNNVCTDVTYTFRHADGSTGDTVATYADGKITFKKTGLITVTVQSNSGSRVETTAQYTFNINEGYNVYNFEEASNLVKMSYYNGQVINFVALTKLVAEDGYQYGYEFVAETALISYPKREDFKTNEEYIAAMLAGGNQSYYYKIGQPYLNRIVAVNRSLYINGNNHVVNASRLPVVSDSLHKAAVAANILSSWLHHGGLISAEPWTSDGSDVTGEFFAKIYDLEVKGNSGINYANAENPGAFVGGYMAGINIGTLGRNANTTEDYSAKYHVDIKNVTSSGFKEGFKLIRVVDGTVENAYAYNCWQNGFSFRSSIIRMKNLKLGPCGAVGIELTPEGSNKAGLNENQNQTVTFEGTFDVEGNLNALNTSYLQTYTVMGYDIPTIVMASLQNAGIVQDATRLSHLQNAQGQVCMVTFIIDLSLAGGVSNGSQALYPSYQAGGIIDATDLPTDGTIDTEHQFIRLTAALAPGVTLGSVLLYNLNYGK